MSAEPVVTLERYGVEIPGHPVAWQRAGTKGTHRFTPPRLREHQRLIADLVAVTWRRPPLSCPVRVTLAFRMHGARTADVDNLAKTVLDALNGVLYEDDRQVERLLALRVQGFSASDALTRLRVAWEEDL